MEYVGINALRRFKENIDKEFVKKEESDKLSEKIDNNAAQVEKNTSSLTWQ